MAAKTDTHAAAWEREPMLGYAAGIEAHLNEYKLLLRSTDGNTINVICMQKLFVYQVMGKRVTLQALH